MADAVAAICWVEREDWDQFKRMFPDPKDLQASYEDWLDSAGQYMAAFAKQGIHVEKMRFDADDFASFIQRQDPDIHAKHRPGHLRSLWAADRFARNQKH